MTNLSYKEVQRTPRARRGFRVRFIYAWPIQLIACLFGYFQLYILSSFLKMAKGAKEGVKGKGRKGKKKKMYELSRYRF